jgi:hypothetical protein
MTINSVTFLKGVYLEIEGRDVDADDNYFDIDAGISRKIVIVSKSPEELITQGIALRSLWS